MPAWLIRVLLVLFLNPTMAPAVALSARGNLKGSSPWTWLSDTLFGSASDETVARLGEADSSITQSGANNASSNATAGRVISVKLNSELQITTQKSAREVLPL